MSKRRPRRPSIPRHIRPGTRRATQGGSELTCLVLASGGGEWAGVDLATGALVRNRFSGDADDVNLFESVPFDVVSLTIRDDHEPVDPARPEAISVSAMTIAPRRLRRRAVRKLLRRLCAPEIPNTPVLHAHGPSVAFVDLDGRSPSLSVIAISTRSIEVMTNPDETVVAEVTWAKTTQMLPVLDPTICEAARRMAPRSLSGGALAETLGAKPAFLVAAFSAVHEGHAKKALLAVLGR